MRGKIIRGSLTGGLECVLGADQSVEDLRVGNFMVIEGEQHIFFSILTDIRLDASNSQILLDPPADALMRNIVMGSSIYNTIFIQPMLMLKKDAPESQPVRTIPGHFASVRDATADDVGSIFGQEDKEHFNIGTPIGMEVPVCLHLRKLIERSNGVFGKSGTGKTFLTRLVLAGIIKSNMAVNLIFDMHNEYGAKGTSEQGAVKGLKPLFGSKVAVFTLDTASTIRRSVAFDYEVKIPYSQIEVEDIDLIKDELNISSAAVETCYLLAKHYGEDSWLNSFLKLDPEGVEEVAKACKASVAATNALYRKLLARLAKLPFLAEKVPEDAVDRIMDNLSRGINVVLEFGQQDNLLSYLLVANILTRRIHHIYKQKSEEASAKNLTMKPLVITIEEAHKFLNPALSGQTIFGTIAREMRKYNVTLLIIDQRPSGIDPEVLSQVGTRITCLLNDEQDISAVLTGVSGAQHLRGIIARLDSKGQALLLGHALPMPVMIKTREYNSKFYSEISDSFQEVSDEEFDKMSATW